MVSRRFFAGGVLATLAFACFAYACKPSPEPITITYPSSLEGRWLCASQTGDDIELQRAGGGYTVLYDDTQKLSLNWAVINTYLYITLIPDCADTDGTYSLPTVIQHSFSLDGDKLVVQPNLAGCTDFYRSSAEHSVEPNQSSRESSPTLLAED